MYSLLLLFLCGFGLPAFAQDAAGIDARALIRRIETQYEGESSHAMMLMSVVTEDYTRELTMESWSEGRDRFLTVIRQPAKERGTATLKVGDDIWKYLPRIDRLIKIPSSLMGDSWMGSHLTNDDLVNEDRVDELYEFEVESAVGDTVTIRCTPLPDAAVVWDRILYRIETGRDIPLDVRYYDERGDLVRTMVFSNVEQVQGRWLPLTMTVRPEDEPDERTVIRYEDIEFDTSIPRNYFSVETLRRL
jgi:outer membrane lipoprotein-sorting protein